MVRARNVNEFNLHRSGIAARESPCVHPETARRKSKTVEQHRKKSGENQLRMCTNETFCHFMSAGVSLLSVNKYAEKPSNPATTIPVVTWSSVNIPDGFCGGGGERFGG